LKIHWAIVVLASAGVILLTWHLRTKHIDFLTPNDSPLPPEDFGKDLAAGSAALQPPIEEEIPVVTPIPPPDDDNLEVTEIPEITEADLGDLEARPGLKTYRGLASAVPPSKLFLLSSTLRIRGEFQRALLALERVIESKEATPEELLEAGQGIGALTSELPPWTVDPIAEMPLLLVISIPYPSNDDLTTAALQLSNLIRRYSGGQLAPVPKINSAETPSAIENPPIALWFSSTAEPPVTSAVMTMTPSGDPSALLEELSSAAFQAVRSHLTKLDFPPPVPLEAPGQELLTRQVSRLMWKEFAESLYPVPLPVEEPSPENDTEGLSEEEN